MERKGGAAGGWWWWVLTGKIKALALVAPLAGVSCLQLREGCEGKAMFLCHVVLPITAARRAVRVQKHHIGILDECVLGVIS